MNKVSILIISLIISIVISVFILGADKKYEKATLAGGCFWCVEADLEKLEGISNVISGYSGGPEKNPTYKDVAYGRTGHYESVQVTYDPDVISYKELLLHFFKHIDPTDDKGQFVDRGKQYRPAVFYHNDSQRKTAEEVVEDLSKSGRFSKKIVTPVIKFTNFYDAEEYHQDYYKKSPGNYYRYRSGSGRDQFIESVWGKITGSTGKKYTKPDENKIKELLTPLQYRVTQKDGTEPAFANKYWDNKKEGIYVDIVSGEPLFSSKDKFKSGTGWPSFTKPIQKKNIVEKKDKSYFIVRIEVRSKYADSHLGHVFDDGPMPTGLRYCINSASLRFIPREKLKDEGYSEYLKLFK